MSARKDFATLANASQRELDYEAFLLETVEGEQQLSTEDRLLLEEFERESLEENNANFLFLYQKISSRCFNKNTKREKLNFLFSDKCHIL